LGLGFFLPLGGLGFIEELALEQNGADGAAEGGGVLEECFALGRGDFGEVGLDLGGGEFLVTGPGDDGVGGEGRRGSGEEEDGVAEHGIFR
jgi:hypothetical protein